MSTLTLMVLISLISKWKYLLKENLAPACMFTKRFYDATKEKGYQLGVYRRRYLDSALGISYIKHFKYVGAFLILHVYLYMN